MRLDFLFDPSEIKYSSELLVELLKDKNEDAFDYFTEYYFKKIYCYVRRRVDSNDLAVDITFDTCRRIFIKIDGFKYRSDEAFEAWIYKNAQTVVYLYYRQQSIENISKGFIILDNEYVDSFPDISSVNKLDNEILEVIHLCLKPKELNIVIKHVYEDKSFKEIAEEFGCATSAVSNSFYRSIKKCRKYLDKYHFSFINI